MPKVHWVMEIICGHPVCQVLHAFTQNLGRQELQPVVRVFLDSPILLQLPDFWCKHTEDREKGQQGITKEKSWCRITRVLPRASSFNDASPGTLLGTVKCKYLLRSEFTSFLNHVHHDCQDSTVTSVVWV